jgi:secreted PhoX family phosphatase
VLKESIDMATILDRTNMSRRGLLAGGAALGLAPILATTSAQAGPKASKASVGFIETALNDHNCGACRMFRGPSSCLQVDGVIGNDCGCKIWAPKIG